MDALLMLLATGLAGGVWWRIIGDGAAPAVLRLVAAAFALPVLAVYAVHLVSVAQPRPWIGVEAGWLTLLIIAAAPVIAMRGNWSKQESAP